MQHLLIIEDEPVIRGALRRLLERHGYQVDEAGAIEEVKQTERYDLIISDLRLPGQPGTQIMQLAPDTPVIIMTSYASVSSAVEAMKLGAIDYIAKPFDHEELILLVQKVLSQQASNNSSSSETMPSEQPFQNTHLLGRSQVMQTVNQRIQRVAPTDATVLILGESGTGKELAARALHRLSQRSAAPFVAFNCASVPEQAIEQALFGQHPQQGLIHTAQGGTLFLDEVGELPITAQGRLLRLLEHNEQHQSNTQPVRIIAATHRDIRREVQHKQFRNDLYFRLRVVEITLPPLRERGDDVIELAIHLLERACQQLGRKPLSLSREALLAIRRYDWPGNVRELSNAIERAAILCDDDMIIPELLAIDHHVGGAGNNQDIADKLSLEEYFRVFVIEHQEQMSETELAAALGISRKTLWQRRQRFGLPRPRKS